VDDYSDFTEILNDYLNLFNDKGITVAGIAGNGNEAIEMMEKCQPDVIILDMIMPELDGIGVLREIRSMGLKKAPKIIVVSASENKKYTEEAFKWGVDSYIVKPFALEYLVSVIQGFQPANIR
jgi:two-component system response regulator (stage 0 sporulation protein A)